MSALYTVINPIVKTVLRSPCHRLLSGNTMLLRYTGRKSGRQYELPISYVREDKRYCGFTARDGKWWLNLTPDETVQLRIAGRSLSARPQVENEDESSIAAGLNRFLQSVPRDARPAGVRLNANGKPNSADVAQAATRLVALYFEPET